MPRRSSSQVFARLKSGLVMLLAMAWLLPMADAAARPDYDDALRIEAPEILRITIVGDHTARVSRVLRTQSGLRVGDVIEITSIDMPIPEIRKLSGDKKAGLPVMTGLTVWAYLRVLEEGEGYEPAAGRRSFGSRGISLRVTMQDSGRIVLTYKANTKQGEQVAFERFGPGDDRYDEILGRFGPLNPGEARQIWSLEDR